MQEARSQMKRLFFGLHQYLERTCGENHLSIRVPTQCKFGSVNNIVSKRNHLLYHFSITVYLLHLVSFYATIYFKKKLAAREMLIEQIIKFELKGPGLPGRTCTPTTGYSHEKTKISK